MEPEILEENAWLVALNKPSGLIVHSDGRTNEPTLADWLLDRFPNLADVGAFWVSPQGNSYNLAGLVHRIDRTTSGVVLAAKTKEAFAYVKSEFAARRIEKIYEAYVHGVIAAEGTIVAEIQRTTTSPKRWIARFCDVSDPRAAITHWKRISKCKNGESCISRIEAHPVTGRTHQIRVHFSAIGHPLVSDTMYAGEKPKASWIDRPALHAKSVSLKLPDGSFRSFVAPLPKEWIF